MSSFETESDLNSTELQLAYEEACSKRIKTKLQVHLAVIGHSEAGKTSFIDRLLGKEFQEKRKSTEGIHTHFITSFSSKNALGSKTWTERLLEASILERDFHESVLAQRSLMDFETKLMKEDRKDELDLQELLDIPDKLNLTLPSDIDHSDKDLYHKDSLELQFKTKGKSISEKLLDNEDFTSSLQKIKLNYPLDSTTKTFTDYHKEEKVSFHEPTATPLIISWKEMSRLLESKTSYAKASDERIPYSVNIWDHGGQNEFIITNQLFLNVEAFILMVMDISLDINIPLKQSLDAKGKFGIPKTPAQILCYWLNAVHILALQKTTKPTITLVLTHKDLIDAIDSKKHIDNCIKELLECIRGKPYASYIKEENIFVVDNREGTEGDFAEIRNKILGQMTKQKSWGIERPTRWLKLEADILEKAKKIEKPFLPISDVKYLASTFAINKKELDSFLSFHHNLGDLIYYPDHKLSDIVVTNPQWFLDMFKTLITPHEFLDRRQLKPELLEELKRAIVSEASLKTLWEGNDVQFLKDVMIKFDLMLPLGSEQMGNKYLIPCILPAQEDGKDRPDPFTGMALNYTSTLEPECGDACHASGNLPQTTVPVF